MIQYHPPKSQIWGHRVGRLSAAMVVERALRFLDKHCTIITSDPAKLAVSWTSTDYASIQRVIDDVEQAIGRPQAEVDLPMPDGRTFHQRVWRFLDAQLGSAAAWIDQFAGLSKTGDVLPHTSKLWTFAWRDEPKVALPEQAPGGMFGVHLGPLNRITTSFSFRDMDRYQAMKRYFKDIGLANLSDKHVRPKIGAKAK
jgi:hypothetical protein